MRSLSALLCCLLLSIFESSGATQPLNTKSVSSGSQYSLALRSDGTVWAFGSNASGALGLGTTTSTATPQRITELNNIIAVSAGVNHSLAVDSQGFVWAWGANNYGQLGIGTLSITSTNRPTKMGVITNAVGVSAGNIHSLIVLSNGKVMACGNNGNLSLGDGTSTTSRATPVETAILTNAVEVAAGYNHSLARTADGKVWAWGINYQNHLGLPGHAYTNRPGQLSLSGVAGIGAGYMHSLAVLTNGQVYAWGTNNYGQLGNPAITTTNVPSAIPNFSNIRKISAFHDHSAGITQDGRVFVWGYNYLNTTAWPTVLSAPQSFASDQNFVGVSQGDGHTLAFTSEGVVWGHGLDDVGQCGDGYANTILYTDDAGYLSRRFAPFPIAEAVRFDRGEPFQNAYNSRVASVDFQQGVELPEFGTELYSYPKTPWFLRIAKSTLQHAKSLSGSTLNRFSFENPMVSFGTEGGGSRLYTGQAYSMGIFGGLIDEAQDTNVIKISAYPRSGLTNNEANVAPTATWTIGLPKRFSGSDWGNFVTNGLYVESTQYGLKTRVEFIDGDVNKKPFGIDWLRVGGSPQIVANTVLAGIRLTHVGSDTNYFYKIEFKGRTQTSSTALAHFVTDGGGNQTWLPLYTLDFEPKPAWREQFLDTPYFSGLPVPPEYSGRTAKELQGLIATPTKTVALTNDAAFVTVDSSPELSSHPLLDQLVDELGKDPLALASYVVNEIGLSDPLMLGEASQTKVRGAVSAPGVKRSALGVFLEGQGSPTEQCALLVYLLRKAGISAGYAFPTNDNLRLLDTTLSRLWRVQVRGVDYANGFPYITNTLVLTDYPWVVANIGSETVHVFPWLKDYEIVEGSDLYDFLPDANDNGYKWSKAYALGSSEILSLAEENTPSALFPKYVESVLRTNTIDARMTLDRIGVRSFNRRHLFPTWSHFPKPNFLTNQNDIAVVSSLTSSTNSNTFLAGIMDKIRVNVYRSNVVSTNLVLTSGDWFACDLNNRKLLLYPSTTNSLWLWLAGRKPSATNMEAFTSTVGHSANPQSKGTNNYSQNDPVLVQVQYVRRSAGLSDPNYYFPVQEEFGSTNLLSCNYGDIAAVCFSFGAATPKMLEMHAEDYWRLERTRLTNSTYQPSLQDYDGTTAMLLGMSYLKRLSSYGSQIAQLHKLTEISQYSVGLAILGKISTNKTQPKVDMAYSHDLRVGTSSLHPESGDSYASVARNFHTLLLTGGSALEHQIIDSTFQTNDSVSTVRLLQLASKRATNGIASPLELNRANYVTLGNSTFSGYGTNKLKDQDPALWQSVTNSFSRWDADYVRILVTPGLVTNQSGSYIGMGALIIADGGGALISGNKAPLNGGFGPRIPRMTYENLPTGVQLQQGLSYANQGVEFYYNETGNPVKYTPPTMAVNFGTSSDTSGDLTPSLGSLAFQVSLTYDLNPTESKEAVRTSEDTGHHGPTMADIRQTGALIFDPVSVISGAFYTDTVDLTLPGPFPLQVRRNYNSHNLADNHFGFGWTLNFAPYLIVILNGTNAPSIQAADPDGAVILYRSTGSNLWTVVVADNPTLDNNSSHGVGGLANAFNGRIEKDSVNGLYFLYGPDGSKRTFKEMSFALTSGTNSLARQRPYLTRWDDHAGNFHAFSYGTDASQNDYGQLKRIDSANGNSLGFRYDFFGRILEAYTLDGRRINYEYDGYGDLVTVTLPDASKWKYEYQHYTFTTNSTTWTDSLHLIKREEKPDGRVIENGYDNLRRVVTQSATVGKTGVLITNAYFAYTNNFSLTNKTVTGTTHVRDVFQNLTVYYYTNSLIGRVVDPLNQATIQDWFEPTETAKAGYYPRSLEATTDKRGLIKKFQYDARGNITSVITVGDLTGNGSFTETATNSATFTAKNLPQTVTDPVGRTTSFYYDDANDPFKLTRTIQSAAGVNQSTNTLSYTNTYEVVSSGGQSRTNQAFALRWEEVRAGSSISRWTFNSKGFPESFTRLSTNAEDPANSDPAVTLTFKFNGRGQLYEQTDAAGRKQRFDFDAMGRLLWKEILDETGQALSREQYFYNRNGELEWYDGPASEPEDFVHLDYDGAGRKIEETHWQAGVKMDGSGVELKSGNARYASTFSDYDSFGNLLRTINPRGVVTTNKYDKLGQLLSREVLKSDGSALTKEQFLYEPGGQPNVQTNSLGAVSRTGYTSTGSPFISTNFDGSVSEWRYDLAGRTVKETLRNRSYWQTIYDDVNRRVTKVFKDSSNAALATNIVEFDRRGNSVRTVDAMGYGFTNVFDGLDRLRAAYGPKLTFESEAPYPGGTPPPLQEATTNYYDAAGISLTSVNAFGEKAVSTLDALGRTTKSEIKDSANQLVRVSTTAYFTNHHGAVLTEGTGTDAITVGSSRVDLQACKLEYSIVSPK